MTVYRSTLDKDRNRVKLLESILQELGPSVLRAAKQVALENEELAALLSAAVQDADVPGPSAPAGNHSDEYEATRTAGARDIVGQRHRIAVDLTRDLRNGGNIPAADVGVVRDFQTVYPHARWDGSVLTIDGVPVPVGLAQINYFGVLRFAFLFRRGADPHRLYTGDIAYDAVNVTDEQQQRLLDTSTRRYFDALTHIQSRNPALFMALWTRDMKLAATLPKEVQERDLPTKLGFKRERGLKRRLLITAAVMNEFERVFDVMHSLALRGNVTTGAIKDRVRSTSSLAALQSQTDEVAGFLKGSVAHARSLFPEMNAATVTVEPDDMLGCIGDSASNSPILEYRHQATVWPTEDKPAAYWHGVELAMVAPVGLIHMMGSIDRYSRLRDRRLNSKRCFQAMSGVLVQGMS